MNGPMSDDLIQENKRTLTLRPGAAGSHPLLSYTINASALSGRKPLRTGERYVPHFTDSEA